MNVVCLVGELDVAPANGFPLRDGWTRVALNVPRRGPHGESEPGVFRFVTVLPPKLAPAAGRGRRGALVSVIGMLAVDVDYSGGSPQAHYVIVAESVQSVPAPRERDAASASAD
jgi:hypothetical protein